MALFSANQSLHFQDQARIFRLGSGETLTPAEGYEVVTVCDPNTFGGECYAALREEGEDEPGLAVRLILQTQDMIDSGASAGIIDRNIERMNMLRTLNDVFGWVN